MSLEPFADRDVVQSAIRITGAGDGLSEALTADPVELDLESEVNIILRGTVTKVTYEAIKDTEVLRRVHTVRATFGTIVTPDNATGLLDGARRRIEEANGVQRLH